MKTHTVRAGDTLSKLALAYYGNLKAWPEIARENRIASPYILQIGRILRIPDILTEFAPTIDVSTTPTGIEEVSVTAKRELPWGLFALLGVAAILMSQRRQ